MKTIKKNDLKLDKEVISKLSQDDLTLVKGGADPIGCGKTDGCMEPMSAVPEACLTYEQKTCEFTVWGACASVDFTCVCLTDAATCVHPPLRTRADATCLC